MKAYWGRRCTAPIILNLGAKWQGANFTTVEEATGTHWLCGRVGFRVNADAMDKGKISCPSWDSNPRSPSLHSHCTCHAISAPIKVKHWTNNKAVGRRKTGLIGTVPWSTLPWCLNRLFLTLCDDDRKCYWNMFVINNMWWNIFYTNTFVDFII
jgi:hypothetical protein